MACIPSYQTCVVASNDFAIDFQLLADSETPVDLTGAVVEIQLLDDLLDPSEAIEMAVEILDPTSGSARASLTGAETLSLLPEATATSRPLTGDLRVSFPSGLVKSYFTLALTIDATRSRPA